PAGRPRLRRRALRRRRHDGPRRLPRAARAGRGGTARARAVRRRALRRDTAGARAGGRPPRRRARRGARPARGAPLRSVDFLKATVLASAGAATALAAVTVAGAVNSDDQLLVPAIAAWWLIAAALGLWFGRGARINHDIERLLAQARAATSLPEQRSGRIMLNRLWPLLVV